MSLFNDNNQQRGLVADTDKNIKWRQTTENIRDTKNEPARKRKSTTKHSH